MEPEFRQLEHAPLPSSPLHLIFRFRHLPHWKILVNKCHRTAFESSWRPTATGTLLRGGPPDLLSQSDDGLVRLLKMSLVSYCSCLSECASCSGTPRSLRRLNSSSGL